MLTDRQERPILTASSSLKEMFRMMDANGITQRSLAQSIKTDTKLISRYRLGQREPGIMRFEEMVAALGYEITLTPIDKEARGDV